MAWAGGSACISGASPILSGSMSFVLSFVFKDNVIPHELHLKKKEEFAAFGCCV